ncbi:cytoplasmic dynein 2 intermediate chain 2-like [Lineus longissimus]|uniref:cytoplasmic dynein 2 intermediate chain 2-like n=1 Tax=Lineus longissimus TaxID=88925 RepID=UPI002B4C8F18
MFQDEALEAVECKSSWKKERSLTESGVQTREILTDEVAVQAIKRHNVEVQTENDTDKDLVMGDYDSEALGDFLKSLTPTIIKELDKSRRSHAFDGYDVSWKSGTSAVTCLHTLHNEAVTEELQVTGLSWNSTGSVIAAATGRFDHVDWCTHKSQLSTWNIERRNINTNKPDTTVDTSSCLMCIAFHPKEPAVIVGGTFNGEVLVWNFSRDDDMLVASSGIGDDSHREPVSKVQWVTDPDSKGNKYNIMSVSSDGKMLIWKLNLQKRTLTLSEGFILMAESLPRHMRSKSMRGDKEMGVTCISFNKEDRSTFVVGSESGGVFKCSLHNKGNPAGRHITSSVQLHSPVTFSFHPHHGPVYAIDCSPHHRNLFATCGTDTSARVYSMLQDKPVLTIEPGAGYLFSTHWSPVRPLVLAMATEDGHLVIYDLKTSHVTPLYKLEAGSKKTPIYTLQFNAHQRQLLATGDGEGNVQIWQLSDELTTEGVNEKEILNEIAGLTTE